MVDNPMADFVEDSVPFDDFYVLCSRCDGIFSPLEMDMEAEDICNNCVAQIVSAAHKILREHMPIADLNRYERITKTNDV